MKTRTAWLLCLTFLVVTVGYSLTVFPNLPARVPIHWNAAGQIDGYGSKLTSLVMTGALLLLVLGMLLLVPRLQARQFAERQMSADFNLLMVLIMAAFCGFHVIVMEAGRTAHLDVGGLLTGILCALLGLMSPIISRLKRNTLMGIRTPWTLASDAVWNATHRLAGKWLAVGSVLGLALVVLHASMLWAVGAILVAFLVPTVYSWLLYRKLTPRP